MFGDASRWLWGLAPVAAIAVAGLAANHSAVERELANRAAPTALRAVSVLPPVDLPIPLAESFGWSARRVDDRLTLSGHVADASARDSLIAAARAAIGSGSTVDDHMAPGAEVTVAQAEAQRIAVTALGHVREGSASIAGSTFAFTGRAAGEADRAAVEAVLSGLPAGLARRPAVIATGPASTLEEPPAALALAPIEVRPAPEPLRVDVPSVEPTAPVATTVPPAVITPAPIAAEAPGSGAVATAESAAVVVPAPPVSPDPAPVAVASASAPTEMAGQSRAAEPVPQARHLVPLVIADALPPRHGPALRVMAQATVPTPAPPPPVAPPAPVSIDAVAACTGLIIAAIGADRILFDTRLTAVTADHSRSLERIARAAQGCDAAVRIEVGGHADIRNRTGANQQISDDRAANVRAALIARGAPADRLVAVGHAAERPVASNRTTAGMALNRRVDFTVRGR